MKFISRCNSYRERTVRGGFWGARPFNTRKGVLGWYVPTVRHEGISFRPFRRIE
jgi:hypothetical protein